MGYCALAGLAGGPLDVPLVFLVLDSCSSGSSRSPVAGACSQHTSRVDRSPPWVPGAAHSPPGSPATLSATLAPPALALPARAFGGEGAAGSTRDPAGLQPPDPLLFFLPASGAGGAVFTVRRPQRTGRMGSGWRGERSCWEGPHLPPQGYHEHGVRSRCLRMARAGGGDGGGGVGSPASLPCSPLPGRWQAD